MLSIANEVNPLIFYCICFVCNTNMYFFQYQPHSTHKPKTSEQKSIQSVNNLTIPKFGGENMGIGELSLTSSQPLLISSSP